MSNNKQNMKLYTEEQVRKMLMICHDSDLYEHISTSDDILETQTPIELPSDEEIGQEFKHGSENWEVRQALEVGAKWMRDKIKGGNK